MAEKTGYGVIAMLLALNGCHSGDTGVNPPPIRTAKIASITPAPEVLPAKTGSPTVTPPTPRLAPGTPKALPKETVVATPVLTEKPADTPRIVPTVEPIKEAADSMEDKSNTLPPAPKETPPKPERATFVPKPAKRATETSAERIERIQQQDVITTHLLDTLDQAHVDSPHIRPGHPVVSEGPRLYRNPWAQGRHRELNVRTLSPLADPSAWTSRSALTLPVNSTITWPVTVPSNALLRFSLAVGTWARDQPTLRVDVRIQENDEWRILGSHKQPSDRIYRLAQWTPIEMPIHGISGQAKLEIRVHNTSGAHRYQTVAFIGEPVIVARAVDERSRQSAQSKTGLGLAENVLLVVVDGQRADSITPQGSADPANAPTLEATQALASSGISFANAFSVSNDERSSTFGLLSSHTPRYGGFFHTRWIYPKALVREFYRTSTTMLPLVLRKHGYRTVAVGHTSHLIGNINRSLDVGFDTLIDYRRKKEADITAVTTQAMDWVQNHRNERWFMMLHFPTPGISPAWKSENEGQRPSSNPKNVAKAYGNALGHIDRQIGRVMMKLEALELTGKTIVILTSAHGRILNPEHDCWNYNAKLPCINNAGLTLYDEEVQVPLIIRAPAAIPTQGSIRSPVSHLDVAPTVLGLIGSEPVPDQLGRNLSPYLTSLSDVPPIPILLQGRRSHGCRWNGFKYIEHGQREVMIFGRATLYDRSKSMSELYDLVRDPGELHNLALRDEQHHMLGVLQDEFRRVRTQLQARRAEAPFVGPTPTPPVTDEAVDAHNTALLTTPATPSEARKDDPKPSETTPSTNNPASRWNTLLFQRGTSKGHFGGTIQTTGHWETLEIIGEPAVNQTKIHSKHTIRIKAKVTDTLTGIRFRTKNEGTPIQFQLTLDGKPIGANRMFVGTYGLKLYSDPLVINTPEQFSLAESKSGGPQQPSTGQAGVFYWRDTESD